MVIFRIFLKQNLFLNLKGKKISSVNWPLGWEKLLSTELIEIVGDEPLLNFIKDNVLVPKDRRCTIEEFIDNFNRITHKNKINSELVKGGSQFIHIQIMEEEKLDIKRMEEHM